MDNGNSLDYKRNNLYIIFIVNMFGTSKRGTFANANHSHSGIQTEISISQQIFEYRSPSAILHSPTNLPQWPKNA
jgi:hypothetical protein